MAGRSVMPMSPLNTPNVGSLRVTITGRPSNHSPEGLSQRADARACCTAWFMPATPHSPSRTAHSRRKRSNAVSTRRTHSVWAFSSADTGRVAITCRYSA